MRVGFLLGSNKNLGQSGFSVRLSYLYHCLKYYKVGFGPTSSPNGNSTKDLRANKLTEFCTKLTEVFMGDLFKL